MTVTNNELPKFTLKSLCEKYNKIEIPVLQREYAQGRDSEKSLRTAFVDYLVENLLNASHVELDFVYGALRKENNYQKTVFIPLDGQQRLTTLWLLHWFIAAKEGKVDDAETFLNRFVYESRNSAVDFCSMLLAIKSISLEQARNIKYFLEDQTEFNDVWHKNPTVSGMLTMLQCFGDKNELLDNQNLFDRLWNSELFSFYFLPLENFGMTDELYIRMNARGEQLTDFEHFKSEFYKSIQNYSRIDEVKHKMDIDWVEYLWLYRKEGTYVTDRPFMNYLKFINKVMYYHSSESNKREDIDFLSIENNRDFYSKDANRVDFLVFAIDALPILKEINLEELTPVDSFKAILDNIIGQGRDNTDEYFILYAALKYIQNHADEFLPRALNNFIRVVRNLIMHTPDNTVREWSRMLPSIDRMAEHKDVYTLLRKQEVKIEGFRAKQLKEERFKALILDRNPQYESELHRMEDHPCFYGSLTNLFLACLTQAKNKEMELDIDAVDLLKWDIVMRTYHAYCEMYEVDGDNKGEFYHIWGDLLDTSMYDYNEWRVWWVQNKNSPDSYSRHPSILNLAYLYGKSKQKKLNEFLIQWERKKVLELYKESKGDLTSIDNPKKQLFLLYVITVALLKKKTADFFTNGYNFGWLEKEKGYFSLFNGIEDCSLDQPIFQTYSSQFRYSLGLREFAALPPEILRGSKRNNLLDELYKWAKG